MSATRALARATCSGRTVEILLNWLLSESEVENDTASAAAGVASRRATGWLDPGWGTRLGLNSISICFFWGRQFLFCLPPTWHIGSWEGNFSHFFPIRQCGQGLNNSILAELPGGIFYLPVD